MLHYLGVNLMSTEEEAVLFELIKKSKGLGDTVAVYPFESI